MIKKIKVFLVDDHEIFRNGLRQLVNGEDDMEVIGEAADGEAAIQALSAIIPDVVIMDIRIPGINGVEASQIILEQQPKTRIIFFSLYDNPDYILSALEMGASGYILKDTSNKIFLNAIRSVYNGKFYFIGDVTDVIVKKYNEVQKALGHVGSNIEISLSNRERQILKMINDNLSTKEIAAELNISARTIETHRLNILRKFKANNIDEVLIYCNENDLLK